MSHDTILKNACCVGSAAELFWGGSSIAASAASVSPAFAATWESQRTPSFEVFLVQPNPETLLVQFCKWWNRESLTDLVLNLPAGLETSKKASYNVFVLDLPGPMKLTPFQTVTMQSIISMLVENCRQVVRQITRLQGITQSSELHVSIWSTGKTQNKWDLVDMAWLNCSATNGLIELFYRSTLLIP